MTNPTWPIGPARTRDGREARIYATDGGGDFPIHGASLNDGQWSAECWMRDGRLLGRSVKSEGDLLPPKLTRDEAAEQIAAGMYDDAYNNYKSITPRAVRRVMEDFEKLKAEGRIDE